MTHLRFSFCYLMIVIWTVVGVKSADASPTYAKPSVVNLQTTGIRDSKSYSSKGYEDWLLRKILPPLRLKNLHINTDMHDLANLKLEVLRT